MSTQSLVDMASDLSYAMSDASTSFSKQCSSVDISRLFKPTATVAKLIGRSSAFTAMPFRWLNIKPRADMIDRCSIGDKIGAGGK